MLIVHVHVQVKPESVEEFRLAQAKIEHRHIVPVYAAGTWDGKPYFTMKYVPAGALNKHLDRFRGQHRERRQLQPPLGLAGPGIGDRHGLRQAGRDGRDERRGPH